MDKSKLKIIGIAGTNGSGKDTLGHILAKYHNYLFISVTELLRQECQRRGIKVNRQNLRTISAEWRRKSGLGVLVDKAKSEYDQSAGKYSGLAIASLRNPGEVDRVHQLSGTVIWLDADPKERYNRIQRSAHIRSHRSDEDSITYEQFIAEELAEMKSTGDEATLNMQAVKERSDIAIDNSHNNDEEFRLKIEKILNFN